MKRFLLTFAIVFVAMTVSAALTALHIVTKSGVITLVIAEKPVIEFNEDRTMTITPSEEAKDEALPPIVISFDDVEKCEYGDVYDYNPEPDVPEEPEDPEEDGIRDAVASTNIEMSFEGDAVVFGNIPEGLSVNVYSIDGAQAMKSTPAGGRCVISRDDLGRGVYVVAIGEFSVKVTL